MHSSIELLNIDWILEGDGSTSQAPIANTNQDVPLTNIPMPPRIGTGAYEAWFLSIGATIYRANYNFHTESGGQLIPSAKVTASFNEPTLMVHTLKKGRVIHQDSLAANNLIFGDGVDLFRYSESISVTPMIDTTENIEMTSLMIGNSFLVSLIGKPLSDQLLTNLGVHPMPKVAVKTIPSYVNRSLQECLKTEYASQLKKVWAQAKALEFISELATYICKSQSKTSTVEKQTRVQMKALHQYLINLDGKLPTIESLAQNFGKSARVLNDTFQMEYGESIFSFVLNHRLKAAHETIKRTSVPLKQISTKLGYAHVNHFSAAFKKKFGYSPGALRR